MAESVLILWLVVVAVVSVLSLSSSGPPFPNYYAVEVIGFYSMGFGHCHVPPPVWFQYYETRYQGTIMMRPEKLLETLTPTPKELLSAELAARKHMSPKCSDHIKNELRGTQVPPFFYTRVFSIYFTKFCWVENM